MTANPTSVAKIVTGNPTMRNPCQECKVENGNARLGYKFCSAKCWTRANEREIVIQRIRDAIPFGMGAVEAALNNMEGKSNA